MPMSPEERAAEEQAAKERQQAHNVWAAFCAVNGRPPHDEDGNDVPDPLEQ